MIIGQGCIFMREKENLIRLLRLIIYQSYNELSKYTVRSCNFVLNFDSYNYIAEVLFIFRCRFISLRVVDAGPGICPLWPCRSVCECCENSGKGKGLVNMSETLFSVLIQTSLILG